MHVPSLPPECTLQYRPSRPSTGPFPRQKVSPPSLSTSRHGRVARLPCAAERSAAHASSSTSSPIHHPRVPTRALNPNGYPSPGRSARRRCRRRPLAGERCDRPRHRSRTRRSTTWRWLNRRPMTASSTNRRPMSASSTSQPSRRLSANPSAPARRNATGNGALCHPYTARSHSDTAKGHPDAVSRLQASRPNSFPDQDRSMDQSLLRTRCSSGNASAGNATLNASASANRRCSTSCSLVGCLHALPPACSAAWACGAW